MAVIIGTYCSCAYCENDQDVLFDELRRPVPLAADRFEAKVARGAGFLDRILGAPQWRPQIDVGRLALASNQRCVLGQLYGTYGAGVEKLRISPAEEIEFGVQLTVPMQLLYSNAWDVLTEAWRRQLTPA